MQLGDDLLGVAAEVGERAAEVEDGELDQQREGVGERQVEVDDLVALDLAGLADHVDDRAVVAVREHAALRRAGGAGGVDERERVLGLTAARRASSSSAERLRPRSRTSSSGDRLERARAAVRRPRRRRARPSR